MNCGMAMMWTATLWSGDDETQHPEMVQALERMKVICIRVESMLQGKCLRMMVLEYVTERMEE